MDTLNGSLVDGICLLRFSKKVFENLLEIIERVACVKEVFD